MLMGGSSCLSEYNVLLPNWQMDENDLPIDLIAGILIAPGDEPPVVNHFVTNIPDLSAGI